MSNKNIIGIKVCLNTIEPLKDVCLKIIENSLLGFIPNIIIIEDEEEFNIADPFKANEIDNDSSVELKGMDGSNFVISYPAGNNTPLTLTWELDPSYTTNNIIENICNYFTITVAYVYDYNDVFWESARLISQYNVFSRSYKGKKMVIDELDEKVIDISNNYGREILLKEVWLIAAWKMWFGKKYFEIVAPKNILLQFDNAIELDNGLVFIQLFTDPFETPTNEIRRKQKLFFELIDYQSVCNKLSLV